MCIDYHICEYWEKAIDEKKKVYLFLSWFIYGLLLIDDNNVEIISVCTHFPEMYVGRYRWLWGCDMIKSYIEMFGEGLFLSTKKGFFK